MKLLILIFIAFLTECTWARSSKRSNFKVQLTTKLQTMTCDENAQVLDAALNLNYNQLQQLLGVQVPQTYKKWMEKKQSDFAFIKTRSSEKTCEQKSDILTALIDYDRAKLIELGVMIGGHRQFKQLIKTRASTKTCEEKADILDAFLSINKDRIKELLGNDIELPTQNRRKTQKHARMMAQIRPQVEGKSCEEKSEILDALLDSDHQKLKELGITLKRQGQGRRRGQGRRKMQQPFAEE